MAIKYDEIYSKVMDNEFSPLELKYIAEAEEYIDQEIVKQFGKSNFSVEIILSVPTFRWTPKSNKMIYDLMEVRKPIMYKEIENRYKNAGWDCDTRIDEYGGMNSCDYWVLFKIKK
jgi:hypothetical protein